MKQEVCTSQSWSCFTHNDTGKVGVCERDNPTSENQCVKFYARGGTYKLYDADGFLLEDSRCLNANSAESNYLYCGLREETAYNRDGSKTVKTIDCGYGTYHGEMSRSSYNSATSCNAYSTSGNTIKVYDENNKLIEKRELKCNDSGWLCSKNYSWQVITTDANGKRTAKSCSKGIDPATFDCQQ